MLEVIEHVVRAERALEEIWRVLLPGGHRLLSTPNHAFYKSRIRGLKGRPLGMEGEHYRFFVKIQLESMLAATGFRILARNSSGQSPLLDDRWMRQRLRRERVLYRIPERLESICAINFVWLAGRVPYSFGGDADHVGGHGFLVMRRSWIAGLPRALVSRHGIRDCPVLAHAGGLGILRSPSAAWRRR